MLHLSQSQRSSWSVLHTHIGRCVRSLRHARTVAMLERLAHVESLVGLLAVAKRVPRNPEQRPESLFALQHYSHLAMVQCGRVEDAALACQRVDHLHWLDIQRRKPITCGSGNASSCCAPDARSFARWMLSDWVACRALCTTGSILLNRYARRMDRHAATRRLRAPAASANVTTARMHGRNPRPPTSRPDRPRGRWSTTGRHSTRRLRTPS